MNTLNKQQKTFILVLLFDLAIIFVMSVGMLIFSGAPVCADEYDFNSLTPGDLNGQDSWQTVLQSTSVDIQVGDYGNDLTQAIRFNQGGLGAQAWALRENDGSFSLPSFTGDHYAMEFDIQPACWGTTFGIGADTNSNGMLSGYGESGVVMSVDTGGAVLLPEISFYLTGPVFQVPQHWERGIVSGSAWIFWQTEGRVPRVCISKISQQGIHRGPR